MATVVCSRTMQLTAVVYIYSKNGQALGDGNNSSCCTFSVFTSVCSLVATCPMHCGGDCAGAVVDDGLVLQI